MTDCLKLTITDFNNMENSVSQAENVSEEIMFLSDSEKTAYSKCQSYIAVLMVRSYLCWNDEVYPKFTVTKVYLR